VTVLSGQRLLVVVLIAVVASVVGVGIAMLGPPSEERARRIDDRRVQELRQLSQAVHLYNSRHHALPASAADLSTEPGVSVASHDPVTGASYDYRVTDATHYEVCAVFDRPSADPRNVDFWSHGAGRQCFTLKADETK